MSSTILHDMLGRLHKVRSRSLVTDTQAGLCAIGSVVFGGITLLSFLEAIFEFSSITRTMIVFLAVSGFIGLFSWFGARPLLKLVGLLPSQSFFALARDVGRFFPEIRDRLLNLLQLSRDLQREKSPYSAELVDASFQDLAAQAHGLNFSASVDRSKMTRWRNLFAIVSVGSILFVALFPGSIEGAAYRLLHFEREFVPPAEYAFDVSPGDKEIVKGENVEVTVKVRSLTPLKQQPDNLTLFHRLDGQTNFEHVRLRPDSVGAFRTLFQNVRGSMLYFAQVEDIQSDWYELKAVDRPIVRSFQLRLDYPAYAKLPPRIQDEFVGDVTALAGTKISLKGTSSKELKEAVLVFGNNRKKELNIGGDQFSSSFSFDTEGSYFIHLKDFENLTNLDPVRYQLRIIPDESPSVTILEPGRNLDIAGTQGLNILIQGKDDFGFSKVQLGFRLVHSRYERPSNEFKFVPIPLPAGTEAQLEARFLWDLSGMGLVPEDVVEYFAEVYDNDAVRGPKSGRSMTYLIRLPSLEEVFTDLDKSHEQSLDELKQTAEEAKKLRGDLESINQDLKKNKDLDWQKQKKLEEMGKKYQEVQKKLEDVKSRLDDMVQKMDQQGVLSQETMEKYLELQQLFDQFNSADLQKALKQMQQAMQNINKDQLRQALQQMTFSEERFRQSVERTINLLKRIQIEQKLDEVKKRAKELASSERELQREMKNAEASSQQREELAKKQEDQARKEASMEKAAKELEEKMQEFFAEMPADKLQKLNEELSRQTLSQQMSKSAELMRMGQMQQAQGMISSIQHSVEQYGENLDALQQEMLQQNAQYVMNEMRRAINNLLELSKREEDLKQQSQSAPPNSPQLRQNAQDQMRVMQDLANVVQGLSEVSQRSFAITPDMAQSIGEALSRMQNAMRNLDVRSGGSASQEQGAAMGALNKAAMQLQSTLQTMMQGGQGGGLGSLLGQLQSLAGQQMSINQQTISMQQAADAARLAQEQEAVRKSIEQLNKEAQTSGEQKKLLGDLEKIAEEMKEVVRNLEQNNVNPETIQKQERILSRLLDASKSMRERDFEKRRKAETGTQVARRSPGELDPAALEGKNRLREDLLKALEQGYSKDYKELIRKYFQELEKTQKRDK